MTGGYLLDTSVVSALVPGRDVHLPAHLAAWLTARADQLYLPCIAVAELAQGIARLHRSGGLERAARLQVWLDGLVVGYAERILPLDTRVSLVLGQMSDAAWAAGRHPGFADVAIAAVAQAHGLCLLTRNLKHFEPLGIRCEDPFVA